MVSPADRLHLQATPVAPQDLPPPAPLPLVLHTDGPVPAEPKAKTDVLEATMDKARQYLAAIRAWNLDACLAWRQPLNSWFSGPRTPRTAGMPPTASGP